MDSNSAIILLRGMKMDNLLEKVHEKMNSAIASYEEDIKVRKGNIDLLNSLSDE